MDADFQQRYLSAEQAYGEGDFERARELTTALLDELNRSAEQGEAPMAWRAVLALLLGHIQFHGLNNPAAAADHYRLVLANQPPETLEELAKQGLERCMSAPQTHELPSPDPDPNPAQDDARLLDTAGPGDRSDDLIRDPFLETNGATPGAATPSTSAMPWLEPTPTSVPKEAAVALQAAGTEPEEVIPDDQMPEAPAPPSLLEGALLRVDLRR